MASIGRITISVVLAVLVPYFYERRQTLKSFYTNHPSRLQVVDNIPTHKVIFSDTIRNCEDVLLDGSSGIVVLSCDPGRDQWNTVMGRFADPDVGLGALWSYKYAAHSFDEEGEVQPIELEGFSSQKKADLHPLGIALWPATRDLYVVNHAKQGPTIEVFALDKSATKANFKRTITHPLINTPNSIQPISDHEIYFSNDHAFKARENPWLSKVESYLAYPAGSVVYMNFKTNEVKTVAKLPFANGVALLNSSHLAVGMTTLPGVRIYAIDAATHNLTMIKTLSTTFLVDNLHVDANGKLLMAGHPYGPDMEAVSATNSEFDLDGKGVGKHESGRVRAASWIAEWDGNESGKLRDLYVGRDYGTACTALRDVSRGWGVAVGLYEKGIMVWKE